MPQRTTIGGTHRPGPGERSRDPLDSIVEYAEKSVISLESLSTVLYIIVQTDYYLNR